MYTDSDGEMAEWLLGLTLGEAAIYVVGALIVSFLALQLGAALGVPGCDDVLDGIDDTFNQIGQSIQNSLERIKQNIKYFVIVAAILLEAENNSGTYVIEYESGHVYVGKGGFYRASTSALFQSVIHGGDLPATFYYLPASSDREAFKNEYILMVDYGFHKTDVLYNKIWSYGRAYYYEDYGTYYPGDPGW